MRSYTIAMDNLRPPDMDSATCDWTRKRNFPIVLDY